jgi:exonuclease III
MRLLAWNMRQGGGSRLARIADALVARDADILGLSEYRGGESATRLLAGLHALGYRYVIRVAPPPKRNGVPIAARCAFREHGSIGSGLPEPYRTMPVTSRIDVYESERVVVLQKLEAWDLPGNNLAEDAVSIGFHLSLSRQLIIVVTSPY